MFASLGVASPKLINRQIPFVSPSAQPLCIDEGIEVSTTPTSVNLEETILTQVPKQGTSTKSPEEHSGPKETLTGTPSTTMDEFNPGMGHDFTGTYSDSPITQTSAFHNSVNF